MLAPASLTQEWDKSNPTVCVLSVRCDGTRCTVRGVAYLLEVFGSLPQVTIPAAAHAGSSDLTILISGYDVSDLPR